MHSDIGAVRADVGAALADSRAFQAAARLCAALALRIEGALLLKRMVIVVGYVFAGAAVRRDVRDRAGRLHRVRNRLDNRGRPAESVARHIDVFHIRLQRLSVALRAAARVDGDAVPFIERRIDLFSDGCDDRIGRQFDRFACRDRAAAAGRVGRAKLHAAASQHTAADPDRREQLAEFHAVLDSQRKFLLVRRHVTFCAAVNKAHLPDARHAHSRARGVHRSVAAADHDDIFTERKRRGGAIISR